MGRKAEFDRAEVLERAMGVFWRAGFQGASMKLLGDAMGLNPGSIYAAFGSKEDLFREALGAYVARVRAKAEAGRGAPRERLERYFAAHITASLASSPFGRGCLLLNSAAEVPSVGPESARMIQEALVAIEAYFRQCIEAARRDSTAEREDTTATARLLVATLSGIASMSRAGVKRGVLEDVARAALSTV